MSDATRLYRPATPPGHDPSRAALRAADPRGWRFGDDDLDAVYRVIAQRRDIRRFRPDPIPGDVLERVLAAAHRAPSVGLMQPWRLIVIRSGDARVAIRQLAQRERLRHAERFGERTREFLDQKVEGIVEAPLGLCVCCDHGEPGQEILGRGTIPDTDVYSTACAIQNLWLAARAEGLGVGWVSFYRLADLRALLGIPERVDPIAYLCLGWPDERPVRPGLETSGWAARVPVTSVVMHERWEDGALDGQRATARPLDQAAAIAARDRSDTLVKPAGSLGSLEGLVERWAAVTGAPPPPRIHASVLVCAADHGHTEHATSLFGSELSAQVAAAAARGETAAGVLAGDGGHRLLVVDVGLWGATPSGVLDRKIRHGSADMTTRESLTAHEVDRACAVGRELVAGLPPAHCLVLGEIGIGNTATAAALTSLLTGAPASATVGRGSGMDAPGLKRKRELVAKAVRRHAQATTPAEILRAAGGLELVALAGAVIEAWERGLPVILDGFATAVAALVATRIEPAAASGLFASHLSAECGHKLVLAELGLEPLLDLRMRLGEASGALVALPLVERAGLLHARMATFAEAGVDEQRR
ncbi:MAG TPA: 5,6-dimethylbenzimidazole synthase [Solirubrobacteraceae bacterium]